MILADLFEGIAVLESQGELQKEVSEIESSYTYDFQEKGPLPKKNSVLYVHLGPLLPEELSHYFENNLSMLVVDRAVKPPAGITVIRVIDTFQAFALLCCNLAQHPSKDLTLIGVTGTNGKTSVTYLIEHILRANGRRTAVFGSLNYRFQDEIILKHREPFHHTTPNAKTFQKLLNDAKSKNITHVIMEASSEGLSEHDLDGSNFDVGVFTNFSPEHLNTHLTLENYFESKASFFTGVLASSKKAKKTACLNLTDTKGKLIELRLRETDVKTLGYGRRTGALQLIYCRRAVSDEKGIHAEVVTPHGLIRVESLLLGTINLFNILSALAAGIALEIPLADLEAGIRNCKKIPGRLQAVPNSLGINIYFDWAHTIDGFRKVLHLLKTWKKNGRLVLVFGCEDQMTPQKRFKIAEVAAKYADELFITLEHLDQESHEIIKTEMSAGMAKSSTPHHWYIDADTAIRHAFDAAKPQDTVVLMGMDLEGLDQAEKWLENYTKTRRR